MNTQHQTMVLIDAEDYKELCKKAERTEDYIQRLSDLKAKEIAEKLCSEYGDTVKVMISLYGDDRWDNGHLVRLTNYQDIAPQLGHVANKLKYWAQEALNEEFGDWQYARKAKKEIEEIEDKYYRSQRLAFYSWITTIVAIGICISILIIK